MKLTKRNRLLFNSADGFYVSDGYQLVDAIAAAPLTKNSPMVLVNDGSDKIVLEGAKNITSVGEINEKVIQQCINASKSNGQPQQLQLGVQRYIRVKSLTLAS